MCSRENCWVFLSGSETTEMIVSDWFENLDSMCSLILCFFFLSYEVGYSLFICNMPSEDDSVFILQLFLRMTLNIAVESTLQKADVWLQVSPNNLFTLNIHAN